MASAFSWVCVKLRLGIPLLYVVLMCTVFQKWAAEHTALTDGILFVMIGIAALSWVVTGVRFLKSRTGRRGREDMTARMVADQLNVAEGQGAHSLRFTRSGSAIDE